MLNWQCTFFSVNSFEFFSKVQIIFWLLESTGFRTLLRLISARFEFDSVIYCNFCWFWVSFIYWFWFAVVSRMVDYLILFLLIFCLMEFFTFFWKTYFVEKVFSINKKDFCTKFVFQKKVKNSIKPKKNKNTIK